MKPRQSQSQSTKLIPEPRAPSRCIGKAYFEPLEQRRKSGTERERENSSPEGKNRMRAICCISARALPLYTAMMMQWWYCHVCVYRGISLSALLPLIIPSWLVIYAKIVFDSESVLQLFSAIRLVNEISILVSIYKKVENYILLSHTSIQWI